MLHGLAVLLSIATLTAPAAQPPSGAPTPGKLALARHAFELNGGAAGVDRFIDLGFASAVRNLRAPNDPDTRAILAKFGAAARTQLHMLSPRAVDAAIRVFATIYTDQELKDMIAFDESPSGRSIREKAPQLAKATGQQIAPMVNQALPGALRRAALGLCADGKCTPKQKEVQAALLKGIPGSAQ